MKYKNLPAVLLPPQESDPPGRIKAIVAVTNNVDRGGERIRPGFFAESLTYRTPKGVWGHDWLQPVAKTVVVEEWPPGDPRLPETFRANGWGGYYIEADFNLDTQRGREAYSDVKFGIVDEFSIGYDPQETQYVADEKVLDLIKGEWYEWSPVLVGMNDATVLVEVKAAQRKMLGDGDWDALVDQWDALDLISIALDYVRERQLLATADADVLAYARGLLEAVSSLIDDLQAALPPEPDAPPDLSPMGKARSPLAPGGAFAREAAMTVAVLHAFERRAAHFHANRTKEGRKLSATTTTALDGMRQTLADTLPALQTVHDDLTALLAPPAAPEDEALKAVLFTEQLAFLALEASTYGVTL